MTVRMVRPLDESSEAQLPLECQPCLILPRGLGVSTHLMCRMYQFLYVRRERWTSLRAITEATYDITGDGEFHVQKAISDLRRERGIKIGYRVSHTWTGQRVEYQLGAEDNG